MKIRAGGGELQFTNAVTGTVLMGKTEVSIPSVLFCCCFVFDFQIRPLFLRSMRSQSICCCMLLYIRFQMQAQVLANCQVKSLLP